MAANPQLKISVSGHVAAAPGTKIVVIDCDYFNATADDPQSIVQRFEHCVVAWEIRRNNFDHTWVNPLCSEIVEIDHEFYALVHPDGQIEFTVPFGHFQGRTLDEFEAFVDDHMRDEIRGSHCLDCGKDLRSAEIWGLNADSPLLQDEVWQSVMPDDRGMLCRADMEKRLGRPLTALDVKKRPRS